METLANASTRALDKGQHPKIHTYKNTYLDTEPHTHMHFKACGHVCDLDEAYPAVGNLSISSCLQIFSPLLLAEESDSDSI